METKAIPLFAEIGETERSAMLDAMRPCFFARGTCIFREGDPPNGFFLVANGKVKLTRARRGDEPAKESLLRVHGPGAMFGELSALDRGPRSSTATPLTDVTLRHLPQDRLQELAMAYPAILNAFVGHLAARLRWADLVLSGLSANDVTGRVAATLLYLADTLGIQTDEGLTVVEHLTQSDLAAMIGATRETVNRTLTDLAARRLIRRDIRKVTILDIDRLRQRVH